MIMIGRCTYILGVYEMSDPRMFGVKNIVSLGFWEDSSTSSYLFIYLFIYKFVQCTGERTIGQ